MKKEKETALEFTLDFFAKVINAHKRRLHYALMVTNEEDVIEVAPAIQVDGITQKVYDIERAQFVPLQIASGKRKTEKAKVNKLAQGYSFTSKESRRKYFFSASDFRRTYQNLVVTSSLE